MSKKQNNIEDKVFLVKMICKIGLLGIVKDTQREFIMFSKSRKSALSKVKRKFPDYKVASISDIEVLI